jgi:hypothetical protein
MTSDLPQLPCHSCDEHKTKPNCAEKCEKLGVAIGAAIIKEHSRKRTINDNIHLSDSIALRGSGPLDDPQINAIIEKVFTTYKPQKKAWFEAYIGCEFAARIAYKAGVTKQRVHSVIANGMRQMIKHLSAAPEKQTSTPKKFKDHLNALY